MGLALQVEEESSLSKPAQRKGCEDTVRRQPSSVSKEGPHQN